MEYLYVFLLMFLGIFGLAMLIKLFADALMKSACRRFDVYVKSDEGLEEFVDYARKSEHIGEINLIVSNRAEQEKTAKILEEKYADVHIANPMSRGGQGR
jgi:hypothetical protein